MQVNEITFLFYEVRPKTKIIKVMLDCVVQEMELERPWTVKGVFLPQNTYHTTP
jgi:hypothetical protein